MKLLDLSSLEKLDPTNEWKENVEFIKTFWNNQYGKIDVKEDLTEKETYIVTKEMLDQIWIEDPGRLIDWIRNNMKYITKYVKELNEAIDDFNFQEIEIDKK